MKITNAMYLISSTKVKKARRALTEALPHFEQVAGASSATISSLQSWQVQAGMRCPHQIWRLMHQSRILSIQLW